MSSGHLLSRRVGRLDVLIFYIGQMNVDHLGLRVCYGHQSLPKERGRNYFPISLGNWHCLVVPFREQFIADDAAGGGVEVGGVIATEFEDSVED